MVLSKVFSPYPGPSEVSRGGRGGRGVFAAEGGAVTVNGLGLWRQGLVDPTWHQIDRPAARAHQSTTSHGEGVGGQGNVSSKKNRVWWDCEDHLGSAAACAKFGIELSSGKTQ